MFGFETRHDLLEVWKLLAERNPNDFPDECITSPTTITTFRNKGAFVESAIRRLAQKDTSQKTKTLPLPPDPNQFQPRHQPVTDAKIEIRQAILKAADKYELTYGELTNILAQELAGFSKDQIKKERSTES